VKGSCILLLIRKACAYFQGVLGLSRLVEQPFMVSIRHWHFFIILLGYVGGVKCGLKDCDEKGEPRCVLTSWCK
jgi:hypothetical protein